MTKKKQLPSTAREGVEAPIYEVNHRSVSSRAHDLMSALSSKRAMFIYKEIFDKPMAMRNPMDECL